ncbi:hypothetical protein [Streptomyces sp. RPA4-5]|uniref:hypothetical protein n=1 Tax=Streptomyces sp. RPA4-5 TaxID=2721245 RepID=UPI002001E360|nr:hypothetical protein [Streptomyces sp. RPA4-5]
MTARDGRPVRALGSLTAAGPCPQPPPAARPVPSPPASGVGHVTRFEIEADFAARYPVRQAGGETILELWVPAEELAEFNRHIVGRIELVRSFRPVQGESSQDGE